MVALPTPLKKADSFRGARLTQPEYDIHNWAPLSPDEASSLFSSLSVPWWIAGGWAIDLHVGEQTREHGDIDVLILRKDQFNVQDYLLDWDLHKTQQPGLKPWPRGEFLNLGVNDVWGRRTPESPWGIQLMFMENEGGSWVFRRDERISEPLQNLGRLTPSGIPYVAPAVQLLFKSNAPEIDRNRADFKTVLPLLGSPERTWLLDQFKLLYPEGHEWMTPLGDIPPH